MKKMELIEIQNFQLNILIKFDEFCKKNKLRYSLCGGSLLGAIRHKAFIPWDNDIDVMMPREDYIKFSNTFNGFDSRYFFSNGYLDSSCFNTYGKIYDKNTKLIEDPLGKCIESFLYIDIFPIDGMPFEKTKQEKHRIKIHKKEMKLYMYRIAKYKIKEKSNIFHKLCWFSINIVGKLFSTKKMLRNVDRLAMKYQFDNSKFNAVVVTGYGARETMPHIVFELTNYVEFCGHSFMSIRNPDYYLTSIYGDYMCIPPKEKQIVHDMDAFIIEGDE